MASLDISRAGTIAQKKVTRIMSAHINAENIAAAGGSLKVGTNNFLIGIIPEKAVLVDAYIVVDTKANSATSALISLGSAEDGKQILEDADVKDATGVVGTLASKRRTRTGMPVYLHSVYTGATTNFGDYTVVIRYDEYTKKSGEYTRFVE